MLVVGVKQIKGVTLRFFILCQCTQAERHGSTKQIGGDIILIMCLNYEHLLIGDLLQNAGQLELLIENGVSSCILCHFCGVILVIVLELYQGVLLAEEVSILESLDIEYL